MNWFVTALKRYGQFSGRASRSEYWYFVIFYILASILLSVMDVFIGTFSIHYGFGLLSGIMTAVLLLPSITVGVRRLHDTDRSGWWLLIAFIPIIGVIVLIVFGCIKSDPLPNRFGEAPGKML